MIAVLGLMELPAGFNQTLVQLTHSEAPIRIRAINALAELHAKESLADGLPALVSALQDGEASVRGQAVIALGYLTGQNPQNLAKTETNFRIVHQALVKALSDPNREVLKKVHWAIGAMGAGPLPVLDDRMVQDLVQGPFLERLYAADAMGWTSHPHALEPLVQALADPHVEVRWRAARSLGRLKFSEAIPNLGKALTNDRELTVQLESIRAIGVIQDLESEPWLLKALRDPQGPVREAALEAISVMASPVPMETLIPLLRDPSPKVRLGAAHAVSRYGEEKALPWLTLAAADEDGEVRKRGLRNLLQYPISRTTLPYVRKALEEPDPVFVGDILSGMHPSQMGEFLSDVFMVVVKLLDHSHVRVKMTAAHFLGATQKPEAVPVLVRLFDQKEWEVKGAALRALNSMDHPEATAALWEAFGHPDVHVGEGASNLLAQRPTPAELPMTSLSHWIQSPLEGRRRWALIIASGWEHPQLIPLLIESVKRDDVDASLRMIMMRGLSKYPQPEALSAIRGLLRDPDPMVREAASSILNERGESEFEYFKKQ